MSPCYAPHMIYIDTCQIFTSAQQDSLRHGGAILRDCLQFLKPRALSGVSTLALDQAAEEFIRSRGGVPAFKGYNGFTGTLCTSRNDQVVHGIPSKNDVLEDGDILSMDCGVIFDALYTDACITVPVGTVAEPVLAFLAAVSATLEDVCKTVVRGGVCVGDISSFIENGIRSAGYTPIRALTGHGLGDSLHQFPDVPNVGKAGKGPVLPVGTMIAIEPIAAMGREDVYTATDDWTVLTTDGSLACHFEHSLLLTETGCEVIA
jgi:methionyl aminopeptidase